MMRSRIFALSLGTVCLVSSGIALAQQTTPGARTDTGWRMPYERGFWGHAGISLGQSKFEGSCPAGFGCDDKDAAYRVYAGGRFNNAVGAEIGLFNLGSFQRGGGDTKVYGIDIPLIAGVPIGANSSIFGKLGLIYARAKVSGTAPAQPGFTTGTETGWGPRIGLGAQVGFTPNWAVRLDLDRYHVRFPGNRENVDTLTAGVQYTFR